MAKKQQESAKNKAAKRQKQADDKTFGLKNKNKSKKVQQYVSQVEAQTQAAAKKKNDAQQARRAAEKKAEEAAKAEARMLLGSSIQQQKVPFGVDPKSVVCAFYKQGLCNKGNKCKFSHDLMAERKTAKKDLYSDSREEEKKKDTMEDWDEETLQSVVNSKHGNTNKNSTDIICKYFIQAIENQKYGWFWVCPNGGDNCFYKHSLPPGFKIKTKEEQRLERQAAALQPKITLEDFIETERKKLPKNLTPVTLETFTKWKEEREARKLKEREEAEKKTKGPMSGRQLMSSGKFLEEEEEGDDWDFAELRKETQALEDAEDDEDSQEA